MKKAVILAATLAGMMIGSATARPSHDPFAEFFGPNSLFEQMFGNSPHRGSLMIAMPSPQGGVVGQNSINTDSYVKDKIFYIKADVPGADKSDIRLSIDHNRGVLNLQVTTTDRHEEHKQNRKEGGFVEMRSWSSSSHSHSRDFPLPDNYDRDQKVQSSLKNGVLTIEVPLLSAKKQVEQGIEEIEVEVEA